MISKNTLNFLIELEKNNNKDWFNENKNWYKESRSEFESFVHDTILKISQWEPRLEPIKPHFKLFRINRDVRFSKDKSPYKTNFGAWISYKGMAAGYPGYYIHLKPGESGIAAGLHDLDTKKMNKLREMIADSYEKLESILSDKDFKKYYKKFGDEDSALKTIPRGFDKNHPAKEYIRHKSFTVWNKVSDIKVTSNDFGEYVENAFKQAFKLNKYLESYI